MRLFENREERAPGRSTIGVQRLHELRGITIFDSAHEPIGTVEEIFYDEATTRPWWLGLADPVGLLLVPIEAASIGDGGLTLPYTKKYVRRSPAVPGDLGRALEQELRAYYGLWPRDLIGGTSSPDVTGLRRVPSAGRDRAPTPASPSRPTTNRGSSEPQKRRVQ